ncbi:MAG: SNF2 helicase associated domain-containing protein, partial [Eubacterium sp.]
FWYGSTAKIGFRLGYDRYYVLKDIENFLDAFEEGEEIRYGKSLFFAHYIENFDEKSQEMIRFLKNHFSMDNNRALSVYRRNYSDIHKYMYLNGALIDLFFKEFGTDLKEIRIDDVPCQVKILESNPDLTLCLKKDREAYTLELENSDLTILRGQERLYVYDDGIFYCCNNAYSHVVSDFLDGLIKSKDAMTIVSADMKAFYSTVLQKVGNFISIQTDEDMKIYEPQQLLAKVFFDAPREDFVTAKIHFYYGDDEHEGFKQKSYQKSQDLEGEYSVEKSVKAYLNAYNDEGNYVYIDGDEDKIFDLFSEGLRDISKTAHVYASEQFKSYKIKPPVSVQVGITVNADLLDLSFDLGDLDLSEIMEVLHSYRQAKKYHR